MPTDMFEGFDDLTISPELLRLAMETAAALIARLKERAGQ